MCGGVTSLALGNFGNRSTANKNFMIKSKSCFYLSPTYRLTTNIAKVYFLVRRPLEGNFNSFGDFKCEKTLLRIQFDSGTSN